MSIFIWQLTRRRKVSIVRCYAYFVFAQLPLLDETHSPYLNRKFFRQLASCLRRTQRLSFLELVCIQRLVAYGITNSQKASYEE